jgi:hypothetical protein
MPTQSPTPAPMQLTAVRPPLAVPNAGVAAGAQPSTAIIPPLQLSATPTVALPSTTMTYGAGGATARPY